MDGSGGFCLGSFALRSDLLCPRRQSKQTAAGGSSRAFYNALSRYPQTPIFSTGARDCFVYQSGSARVKDRNVLPFSDRCRCVFLNQSIFQIRCHRASACISLGAAGIGSSRNTACTRRICKRKTTQPIECKPSGSEWQAEINPCFFPRRSGLEKGCLSCVPRVTGGLGAVRIAR